MTEIQYTTVDRVLAKFHRDFRGTAINESDAIEWIGEALGFLNVQQVQEEAVAFLEVKNYEADLPAFFNMAIQVAKKKNWTKDTFYSMTPKIVSQYKYQQKTFEKKCNCNFCGECKCQDKEVVYTDCQGNIIGEHEQVYYRPRFDLQWEYSLWRDSEWYNREFIPVRLSNHTFFNSIVCKEHDKDLYRNTPYQEEYTITGTVNKKLRFSFKEGLTALSYLRTAIDRETGYPLIPDNESYLTAITYYMKWKIAEWYQWNGREGFQQSLPQEMERKWLKYARQAKNYMKMPKSLDDFQNIMEQTYSLPNLYKYKNFFGNYNYQFGERRSAWLK